MSYCIWIVNSLPPKKKFSGEPGTETTLLPIRWRDGDQLINKGYSKKAQLPASDVAS